MDLELISEPAPRSALYTKKSPRPKLENNKVAPADRSVHEWYRFVLSFPPHLVSDYLVKFGITGDCTVLDPFCGTGTTVTECKKRGINYVGVEANPVACFAAQVKTDWSPNGSDLMDHACKVAGAARQFIEESGFVDDPVLLFDDHSKRDLLTLPQASYDLLLTNSISPIPLHKTLALLSSIESNRDERFYKHERLALARATSAISDKQSPVWSRSWSWTAKRRCPCCIGVDG